MKVIIVSSFKISHFNISRLPLESQPQAQPKWPSLPTLTPLLSPFRYRTSNLYRRRTKGINHDEFRHRSGLPHRRPTVALPLSQTLMGCPSSEPHHPKHRKVLPSPSYPSIMQPSRIHPTNVALHFIQNGYIHLHTHPSRSILP